MELIIQPSNTAFSETDVKQEPELTENRI